MLLKHWSTGHAQFICNLRTNYKIVRPEINELAYSLIGY